MAVTKFLARDLTIEVENAAGNAFLHIGGVESLTHSPSTERADSADFDSNGRKENIVVERGDSWALSGFQLEDVANGDRDAGQARVEVLAQLIGLAGTGTFKITSPGGNTITFDGTVEVTQGGGGHNDLATWGATIEVSGDVVYA